MPPNPLPPQNASRTVRGASGFDYIPESAINAVIGAGATSLARESTLQAIESSVALETTQQSMLSTLAGLSAKAATAAAQASLESSVAKEAKQDLVRSDLQSILSTLQGIQNELLNDNDYISTTISAIAGFDVIPPGRHISAGPAGNFSFSVNSGPEIQVSNNSSVSLSDFTVNRVDILSGNNVRFIITRRV